jgi:hypothetical protein
VIAVLVGQGYRPKQCCRILGVASGGYFGVVSLDKGLGWRSRSAHNVRNATGRNV